MADQPIDTTDQQAVTVAQEDRAAAALIFPTHAMTIMSGGWDETENVQVFARHRLASVSSASAETWDGVAQWCEATFGPCGAHRMAERAMEEGAELLDETSGREEWTDKARIEVADMLICLSRVPGIWSAVEEKMAINRARTWDLRGDGTGYHVKLAASPEPVPATNQAGEVERSDDEVIAEFAFLYHAYGIEADDKLAPDALELKRKVLAALATQPATSQEGEDKGNHDCLAKRRPGEPMFILLGRDPDAWQIVRAWAARRLNAGGDPEHCLLGMKTANAMRDYAADPANRPASAPSADAYPFLAAAPTPPTLSEDLREALEPFAKVAKHMGERQNIHVIGWNGDNVTYADFRRLAALAQVKAS